MKQTEMSQVTQPFNIKSRQIHWELAGATRRKPTNQLTRSKLSTHPAIRHPKRWKFIFETRFFVCSSQNEPLTPQHYSKVTLNESNAHTSEVSLRQMLQPSAFRQKRTKHRNWIIFTSWDVLFVAISNTQRLNILLKIWPEESQVLLPLSHDTVMQLVLLFDVGMVPTGPLAAFTVVTAEDGGQLLLGHPVWGEGDGSFLSQAPAVLQNKEEGNTLATGFTACQIVEWDTSFACVWCSRFDHLHDSFIEDSTRWSVHTGRI